MISNKPYLDRKKVWDKCPSGQMSNGLLSNGLLSLWTIVLMEDCPLPLVSGPRDKNPFPFEHTHGSSSSGSRDTTKPSKADIDKVKEKNEGEHEVGLDAVGNHCFTLSSDN